MVGHYVQPKLEFVWTNTSFGQKMSDVRPLFQALYTGDETIIQLMQYTEIYCSSLNSLITFFWCQSLPPNRKSKTECNAFLGNTQLTI